MIGHWNMNNGKTPLLKFKYHYKIIKTEYWVIIYESHDSDLIIFVILFANSSDDTGLMWSMSNIFRINFIYPHTSTSSYNI